MRIGQRRHRVTIQQTVTSPDGQGGNTKLWRDVATVWASVEGRGGREFQTARQTRATLTDEVGIRFRDDVASDMRVIHRNRVLSIVQPPMDPTGRRRDLLLFCEMIEGETP